MFCDESKNSSYQIATTLLTVKCVQAIPNSCMSRTATLCYSLPFQSYWTPSCTYTVEHLTHSNIHVPLSSVLRHVQNISILSFFMSLRALLLFSISDGKGCITTFSKHCCKWSRMDVPSVLKCKYWGSSRPSTKSSGKSQRERTMHNSLNYIAYQKQRILHVC